MEPSGQPGPSNQTQMKFSKIKEISKLFCDSDYNEHIEKIINKLQSLNKNNLKLITDKDTFLKVLNAVKSSNDYTFTIDEAIYSFKSVQTTDDNRSKFIVFLDELIIIFDEFLKTNNNAEIQNLCRDDNNNLIDRCVSNKNFNSSIDVKNLIKNKICSMPSAPTSTTTASTSATPAAPETPATTNGGKKKQRKSKRRNSKKSRKSRRQKQRK